MVISGQDPLTEVIDYPRSRLDVLQQGLAKQQKPLCLIGMMGSGKSAMGMMLSKWLACPFWDADKEIERAANASIPEIFAQYGEAYFRKGEYRVTERLLRQASIPSILSSGGGAFIQDNTRDLLKQQSITIWLKADFETLWPRLQRNQERPLLQDDHLEQRIKTLLEQRNPIYQQADITVESHFLDKPAMARKILDALCDYMDGTKGHETP